MVQVDNESQPSPDVSRGRMRAGITHARGTGQTGTTRRLFVVVGSAIVFTPAIWLLQRWTEAVAHDPADAWGARWLGEHLTAHPYLTAGVGFFSIVLSSGMVLLI